MCQKKKKNKKEENQKKNIKPEKTTTGQKKNYGHGPSRINKIKLIIKRT